jgi:nitrate reductase gamma subunit
MGSTSDFILYAAFPYMAVLLAIVGSVYRFRSNRYSFSALSSQFLEGRRLFWGSAPFHYGILIVLAGHLVAFLFPRSLVWFNGVPVRLFILETTALAFGLLTLFGLVMLVFRRAATSRVRVVTSRMDIVLLALLLTQVATGVFVAIFHRWGSAWSVHTTTPYLASLAKLSPEPQYIAALPLAVRLHILNAWLLVAIVPFTRLVHFLIIPLGYLWRPYQLVIWNRRTGQERVPPA